MDLHNLSDRELLILTAQKVEKIEAQQAATNGIVAELKQGYFRIQGALWVLGVLMVAGFGLAGVIMRGS